MKPLPIVTDASARRRRGWSARPAAPAPRGDEIGSPRVWLLAVPLARAAALGQLVALANDQIDSPEPQPSDGHGMTMLAEVRIGPGEALRAMFVDADKPEQAGLALWRVEDPDGADAIFTSDVVAVGLNHASELCNLVAQACLGHVRAPIGGTVH